ncbi:MAG: NYN domain-containing protein [Ignavibacteriae bacterium]|nr:MAG: NYN domain-containing protein [Ignavibacteriota bacterium]
MSGHGSLTSERVEILIDGGNFYHLVLKRLGCHENNFDFESFAQYLQGDKRTIIPFGKRYYIGTVREMQDKHETTRAMTGQNSLFGRLESQHWCIKTSKLRTRVETVPVDDRVSDYTQILQKGITSFTYHRSREKGIDVKLATDLIVGALDDKFDAAIVVSSDTDLIPALDIVRHKFGKHIEYIGFSSPELRDKHRGIWEAIRPTNAMIHRSDSQRVLPIEDLQKYIIS